MSCLMSRTNASNLWEIDKAFLLGQAQRMEKSFCGPGRDAAMYARTSNHRFPPLNVYSQRLLAYRHLLPRLSNSSSCVVYNKYAGVVPSCIVISATPSKWQMLEPPDPTFFPMFVFLSFLHNLSQVSRTKLCRTWYSSIKSWYFIMATKIKYLLDINLVTELFYATKTSLHKNTVEK